MFSSWFVWGESLRISSSFPGRRKGLWAWRPALFEPPGDAAGDETAEKKIIHISLYRTCILWFF